MTDKNAQDQTAFAEPQKILVVDDDPDFLSALSDVLRREGYDLVTAPSGREAIERLRQDLSLRLIILDLLMPDVNGWEFRLLQWKEPSIGAIPVILVSGAATLEQTAAMLQIDHFLPKPVRPERLINLVKLLM